MGIRSTDFAGTWYPGSKGECGRAIRGYMEDLPLHEGGSGASRYYGGIVPHAGWYFSGKTALSVFNSIHRRAASLSERDRPDTFFLFGMHLPANSPHYLFIDEGLKTPFGTIKVNARAAELLGDSFDFIREDAGRYTPDNTIELQLPFIKFLFPEASIVAAGISPNETAVDIGEKAAAIAEDLGMVPCFIGSTDLTHYGPNYGFTPQGIGKKSVTWVKEVNDKKIVDAFLSAEPLRVLNEARSSHNACCSGAAAAAIAAARRSGAKTGYLTQYTTSYDIHPDSSFVGYAGVVY